MQFAGFLVKTFFSIQHTGTFVMSVPAQDKDDPQTSNGRLGYRILSQSPESPSDAFVIHKETGNITLAAADLDPEVGLFYSF